MKILTSSVLFLAALLPAQEQAALNKLIETISPSIVTVRVVAEIALPAMMGGEKHETKQEMLGTVVDKSGLVLVPTSSLDPGAEMSAMFGEDADVTSTVTSLKVVIGDDAKELVATVVAKDEKLGFSYVKIQDLGERQLTPLSLAEGGALDVGTTVWSVRRLAEAYDFAPFVDRNLVVGRIKKPRNAWLLGGSMATGSPVFTADGKLCGVVASIDTGTHGHDRQSMMMSMFSGGGAATTTFVVSGQAAANSIAQALEAAQKAPAKPADKDGDGK